MILVLKRVGMFQNVLQNEYIEIEKKFLMKHFWDIIYFWAKNEESPFLLKKRPMN